MSASVAVSSVNSPFDSDFILRFLASIRQQNSRSIPWKYELLRKNDNLDLHFILDAFLHLFTFTCKTSEDSKKQ